jgi:hypothetical protein
MLAGGDKKLKIHSFSEEFDFATYLTVYVDELMDDLLQLQNSTWYFFGAINLLTGMFAGTVFKDT